MVDIISKREGPRREDVAAKRLINENRQTIERLANHLSGGQYAARRQPPKPPKLSGFVLHDLGGIKQTETEQYAYVRISVNGRVVLVDSATGKQLHFLGEIRNGANGAEFVLASGENKFYSPLNKELSQKLADLDHKLINNDCSEEDLKSEIGVLLGLE